MTDLPSRASRGWRHQRPPRLLFVASRPARATTSGPLVLHRHLTHIAPRFQIVRAHLDEGDRPGDAPYTRLPLSPFWLRMQRGPRARWFTALDLLFGLAVPRRHLRSLLREHRPDLVLTVAEPPVFLPLVATARSARIPVVNIVHDWAPVWLDVPGKLRPLIDRRFIRDNRAATLTLNVSDELAARFGSGPRQRTLPPVPGPDLATPPPPPAAPFHVLYAGIFHYFHRAEMVGLANELLRRKRPDLLRLTGLEPDWSDPALHPVRSAGFYRGFLNDEALENAFLDASALLVICPFSSNRDAFARYSFPSKLTEYTRWRRPLIVWAPPHSAAVTWALRENAALVVTDPAPSALVDALLRLEADPALRAKLTSATVRLADTFSADKLNARFEESLWHALCDPTL